MSNRQDHESLTLHNDIIEIKRTLSQFEKNKSQSIHQSSYSAYKTIYINILIVNGLLLTFEWISNNLLAKTILDQTLPTPTKIIGILSVGFLCGVLLWLGYSITTKKAKHFQEDHKSFIKRNFKFMNEKSNDFDILIKYLILSTLILASQPELAFLICYFFVADYLLQARLFYLREKARLVLAGLTISFGVTLYYFGLFTLWPLFLIFSLWTTLSLYYIKSLKRIEF